MSMTNERLLAAMSPDEVASRLRRTVVPHFKRQAPGADGPARPGRVVNLHRVVQIDGQTIPLRTLDDIAREHGVEAMPDFRDLDGPARHITIGAGDDRSPNGPTGEAGAPNLSTFIRWLAEHWAAIVLGVAFGLCLIAVPEVLVVGL